MDLYIESLARHPGLVPVVADWHFAEWGHADPGGSAAAWAERLGDRSRAAGIPSYYVAFAEGTPVGSVGLCESDMSTHPEWGPWLTGLFVLEGHRRRGAGGLLVLHALEAACLTGARCLFLHTAGAESLYLRHGWELLRRESYEGEEVSIMRHGLAS